LIENLIQTVIYRVFLCFISQKSKLNHNVNNNNNNNNNVFHFRGAVS